MAASIWKLCTSSINPKICSNLNGAIRSGHHLRGKPPGVARTLDQRLQELNYKDPELYFKVDIGLPPPQKLRAKVLKKRIEVVKANKQNENLEKLSRNKKLLVNLDESKKDWLETDGPQHIKAIANHFGIYDHLFGDAYFIPRVPINILYENENGHIPVYYGNNVKPVEAINKPLVNFESEKDSLWTLILTNPDGHLTKKDSEYVHWFIGNIPGNNIEKGELVYDYLQPFPPKGTGYHRYIFILYKQDKKIDYKLLKKDGKCLDLEQRTFSTLEFYREHQDALTPAGLSFFQSDWDQSLRNFFHNTLNIKEPIFEYDFPAPYIRPQEWFALRKPFNLYLDKYRDQKQINKEFLAKKLKEVHPFKPPKPPLPYPNAQYFDGYVPSWLKLEIKKERLKWGRINDIESK
nr:39S ribosomal protein L38, mitochondrial [Onthophagus taurus]